MADGDTSTPRRIAVDMERPLEELQHAADALLMMVAGLHNDDAAALNWMASEIRSRVTRLDTLHDQLYRTTMQGSR